MFTPNVKYINANSIWVNDIVLIKVKTKNTVVIKEFIIAVNINENLDEPNNKSISEIKDKNKTNEQITITIGNCWLKIVK